MRLEKDRYRRGKLMGSACNERLGSTFDLIWIDLVCEEADRHRRGKPGSAVVATLDQLVR